MSFNTVKEKEVSSIAVLGCMWGDEAKAKIVDVLGECADMVVRFQGGSNAGHTIHLGEKKYVFHSVPSGILYPGCKCVIASGVVIDPYDILQEMQSLQEQGISFAGRLFIDMRCAVVLPLHRELDKGRETGEAVHKIGTTQRGIGPAYADDRARVGIRLVDLQYPLWLRERLSNIYQYHGKAAPEALLDEQTALLTQAWERLKQYVVATDRLIRTSYLNGESVLFEGAQGTLLDINYGTYPYVTSSNTMAGGITTGAGIPLTMIEKVMGVYKAYCTRVGTGPMPTELFDEIGDSIRRKGNEFGATTGRPRRIGWFDAVAARYTAELNGLGGMAVTLLDVLSGLEEVKICTAYWQEEQRYEDYPADPFLLNDVHPEYLTLKGWEQDITGCRSYRSLPKQAKEYLEAVTDLIQVPLEIVSVGKERSQTIILSK